MDNIIDIHTHILYGVDDGAKTIDESILLLDSEIKQGATTVFVTPHSFAFDDDHEKVYRNFDKLKGKAKRELNPSIKLYLGCEIYCDQFCVDDVIDKLINHIYPTMNGTEYILIEFDSEGGSKEEALYCINKLVEANYIPIIAHAERYHWIQMQAIKEMKEIGAKIQINAYSIANEKDKNIQKRTHDLLIKRYADFIGSDTHRLNHRPPIIQSGMDALKLRISKEYENRIKKENASLIF